MQETRLQPADKSEANGCIDIKPIWRIDSHFRCPVIGLCLSLQELKRILKKTGVRVKHLKPFQLHTTAMENVGNENKISRKLDIYLKRKFKRELSEFGCIDESRFKAAWKVHLQKGEITPLVWIAAVRSDLSNACLMHIFGDIHMLSYKNVCDACAQNQRFARQQEMNRRLSEKMKTVKALFRKLKKERDILKSNLNKLQLTHETLKKEKEKAHKGLSISGRSAPVDELRAENSKLQAIVREEERAILRYKLKIKSLEDQNKKLRSHLHRQEGLTSHLREEMNKTINQLSFLNQCNERCPAFDLCAKRVLIVGGITKLQAYYRKLVEEKGGVFEYHDGYMNGGKRGLERQVKRSDVVLCPVNCNSHTACLSVKKLCQKHRKPIQMLSSASLSAISKALFENAGTNSLLTMQVNNEL